jgi:hypothetical protein
LALLALVPAIAGPLPAASASSLDVALCSGGSLPIPQNEPAPGKGFSPCCAKGCHGGSSRKRLDRAQ